VLNIELKLGNILIFEVESCVENQVEVESLIKLITYSVEKIENLIILQEQLPRVR
jgi:hypothetical protein